nr:hypothetical protein [Tanacetum cinerariifolium]
MARALMAKAFKLNYSTPTNNNQRISSNPRNRQIAQPGMNMGQHRQIQMVGGNGGNQFRQYVGQNAGNSAGYNDVIGNQIGNDNPVAACAEGNAAGKNRNQTRCYNCMGVGHYARNCTVRPRRRDVAYLQTQLLIAQKEEAGIQLQAEDALVYDTDGSAEISKLSLKTVSLKKKLNMLNFGMIDRTVASSVGDLKGKSKDTSCVSDTRNPLSQKLENENVELEFQVLNYARENAHLKATYKNLFDSIFVSRAQTQTIIASLQNKLQSNIYINAKLRRQLFKKVSDQKDKTQDTSKNTKFAKQPIVENLSKIGKTNALSKPVTSNSVSTPQESKSVNNDKVIAPGMFRINPSKTSREEKQTTLRPEDHSLGAIQSMIRSPLRLRVVEARIKKLK